jgi:hypothetical protein
MYQLHMGNEMMKMLNQNMLYTYPQLSNTEYKLDIAVIDIFLMDLNYLRELCISLLFLTHLVSCFFCL